MHRSRSRRARALVLGAAMLSALPVAAETGLKLSGFGTVGVVVKSAPPGWGFMRSNDQPGSLEEVSATPDTRVGLQLDWRPRADLEGTLQAVLHDRPAGTPAGEAIKWAYIGWRPLANSRLRLGRTSPDLFLFASSRHVGYAIPWVRPPVDMYGFMPFYSLDGLEGTHQWLSEAATWQLRAAYGRFSASTGSNSPGVDRIPVKGNNTIVITGQREADGLLVKATFAQARASATLPPEAGVLTATLDQLSALPIPGLADPLAKLRAGVWSGGRARYTSVGMQYDAGSWLLHGEISRLDASGGSLLPALRGYMSLGYRLDNLTLFGMAGQIRAARDTLSVPDVATQLGTVIGPIAAAQVQGALVGAAAFANGYRYDQRTTSVGLRWDFASQAALKVQLDRVRVSPNGAAMWFSDGGSAGARNTVFSVALDFVWGQ